MEKRGTTEKSEHHVSSILFLHIQGVDFRVLALQSASRPVNAWSRGQPYVAKHNSSLYNYKIRDVLKDASQSDFIVMQRV